MAQRQVRQMYFAFLSIVTLDHHRYPAASRSFEQIQIGALSSECVRDSIERMIKYCGSSNQFAEIIQLFSH